MTQAPSTMQLRAGVPDPRIWNVHHMDERGVWATHGRRILFSPTGSKTWAELARFPTALAQGLAGISPLAGRVLRLGRCNVYPTWRGGVLAIRSGQVYHLDAGGLRPLCKLRGGCLMNRAIAETREGELYFGEYFTNPHRLPVRIWRVSPDLTRAEVACELDSPRVRHVHAVHVDPFDDSRLWVTAGDFQDECYIGYSDDGFRTTEWLGDGSQTWRAVGLIFQEKRICWMTDSHLEPNRIVSMNRATHEITLHGERDASTWYQTETTDGLYLATSCVEPGPGIQTRHCNLMASENGTEWTTLERFAKDWLPFPLFGFGFLSLPSGRFSSQDFWLTGGGVSGLNHASQPCAVDWPGNRPGL